MQNTGEASLGMTLDLNEPFEQAVDRVIAALKQYGFGVITQIDVRQTLKEKLDLEFRPYKILGACNPALAHRALEIDPQVGLMLPCNVTVSELKDGSVEVAIVDPRIMVQSFNDKRLSPVSEEAGALLKSVAQSLRQ